MRRSDRPARWRPSPGPSSYGSISFDRLAPLYLVALSPRDLGVPSAAEGTLAPMIGFGWALAMPIVRTTTGRFDDRSRIAAAATPQPREQLCTACFTGDFEDQPSVGAARWPY